MTFDLTQAVKQKRPFYFLQTLNLSEKTFLCGPLQPMGRQKTVEFKTFYENEGVSGGPFKEYKFQELLEGIEPFSAADTPSYNFQSSSFEDYEKRFQAFQDSDLEKAVLYKKYKASDIEFIEYRHYLKLLQQGLEKTKNKRGYLYGFYDPDQKKALLGFSPEYLFQKSEGLYTTTAVAGTQTKTDFKGWSKKLTEEHRLVEQGIQKSINQKVDFTTPQTLEYGDLLHLSSTGTFQSDHPLSLHPTSAVGTLPQNGYKSLDLGPEPRSYFGGYVRVNDGKDFDFALVLIRGCEWSSDTAQVCIGGGVISSSSKEEEWKELDSKWKQFKKLWEI